MEHDVRNNITASLTPTEWAAVQAMRVQARVDEIVAEHSATEPGPGVAEMEEFGRLCNKVERECCQKSKDFRPYLGAGADPLHHDSFCIHCGQRWETERKMDAAGSMGLEWVRK